ncbi:MAG: hypothetical protein KF762_01820 [Acidobacteria bacterium]|nr:hypothetical protein [Acidobacteriota bacterium]
MNAPEPVNNGHTPESELLSPIWSVISFDRLEGSALTYAAAAELLNRLDSEGVAGLCVVTDDVGSRVKSLV